MKGADGVAEHPSATLTFTAAAAQMLPALPAGSEYVVFAYQMSASTAATMQFTDGAAAVLHATRLAARNFFYADPCGIFRVGDGQSLEITNDSPLVEMHVNITYEIRPTGV